MSEEPTAQHDQVICDEALKWFAEIGVIKRGHFVLTSGKHSDTYVDKRTAYPHVEKVSWMCAQMASHFYHDDVEAVASPVVGGIIIGHKTAEHLAKRTQATVEAPFAVFADKSKDGQKFEFSGDHAKLISGRRVLIADDILTTGGSIRKMIEAIRQLGGEVIGVVVLCNRGGITAEQLGVPRLFCLTYFDENVQTWDDDKSCSLCQAGIPVDEEVGKGKDYLALKAKEAAADPMAGAPPPR